VGSYLLGDPTAPSVGASGAIFGLFGVLLVASRIHDPVLDRQGRALVGQIGGLIVLNLIIGFGAVGIGINIDNNAHVGGLLAGLWLGFVLVPRNVRTLRDLWQVPPDAPAAPSAASGRLAIAVRLLAVAALVTVLLVGIALGSNGSRFGQPARVSEIGRPVQIG
jgi:rhomboid protease GluP